MNVFRFVARLAIDILAATPTVIYPVYVFGFDVAPWAEIPIVLAWGLWIATPVLFGLGNALISNFVSADRLLTKYAFVHELQHSGVVVATLVLNLVAWLLWTAVLYSIVLLLSAPLVSPIDVIFVSAIAFPPLLLVSLVASHFLGERRPA